MWERFFVTGLDSNFFWCILRVENFGVTKMLTKIFSLEMLREFCKRENTNSILRNGLESIINGHLLLQSGSFDPEHPDINFRAVVVIFQKSPYNRKGIPESVKEELTAKYGELGWNIEFGQDWRSGGPWILCSIKNPGSAQERMARITAKFKKLGHDMSEWREENGRYSCECGNDGCKLSIMFSVHQGVAFYYVGSLPMQDYQECPCHAADV